MVLREALDQTNEVQYLPCIIVIMHAAGRIRHACIFSRAKCGQESFLLRKADDLLQGRERV